MNSAQRCFSGIATTAAGVAIAVLLGPTLAVAASCSGANQQVVTSNRTLAQDWETTDDSAPCFILRNGANLKTNGYSISCTDASCSIAVQCDDSGSVVQSASHNDGDHVDIDGPFDVGTENCSQVKDLRIDGASIGVESRSNDADKVTNNVIVDSDIACIDAVMIENSDIVADNVCLADGGDGIRIEGKSSADGPRVHKNVIRGYDDEGVVGNATHYRVLDNLILDPGSVSHDALSVGVDAVVQDNVCEDDTECDCDVNDILDAPPVCLENLFG